MTRVLIKHTKDTEGVFYFNCMGYGWIKENNLDEKNNFFVQLEDDFEGARAYSVHKDDLKICEEQPKYTY